MHANPRSAEKFALHPTHKHNARPPIVLSEAEKAALVNLLGSEKGELNRIERRVRIVLLAASGWRNQQISDRLGVSINQITRWISRYATHGIAGIENELPRGAPSPKLDVARLLELALQTCPDPSRRWSTRKMAAELGVSASTVSRHSRKLGLSPFAQR